MAPSVCPSVCLSTRLSVCPRISPTPPGLPLTPHTGISWIMCVSSLHELAGGSCLSVCLSEGDGRVLLCPSYHYAYLTGRDEQARLPILSPCLSVQEGKPYAAMSVSLSMPHTAVPIREHSPVSLPVYTIHCHAYQSDDTGHSPVCLSVHKGNYHCHAYL